MKFLRRIMVVAVCILVAFSSTNCVFAKLPEETLRMYAENGIYYYDPTQSCVSSTQSTVASNPTAAAAEGVGSLSGLQVGFAEQYHDIAEKLSINYGIPWEAVVAQGILESASGTSFFATDRNNFFGLGAVDSNPDLAYSYATAEEGWKGYYEFINNNSRYREHGVFSGDAVTDPYAYLKAIKSAGYATAEDYVEAVGNVIRSVEQLSEERGWKSSAALAEEFPEWRENAEKNAEGGSEYSESASSSDSVGFCDGASAAGLISGGMSFDEAQAFMQYYREHASAAENAGTYVLDGMTFDVQCSTPTGGTNVLANCSAFSRWFVGKYTDAGNTTQTNGDQYVDYLASIGFETGGAPRPYAIFSRHDINHTGVILGVDEESGTVIVGHANCGGGLEGIPGKLYGITATQYSLAETLTDNWTFAYTDGRLTGGE